MYIITIPLFNNDTAVFSGSYKRNGTDYTPRSIKRDAIKFEHMRKRRLLREIYRCEDRLKRYREQLSTYRIYRSRYMEETNVKQNK